MVNGSAHDGENPILPADQDHTSETTQTVATSFWDNAEIRTRNMQHRHYSARSLDDPWGAIDEITRFLGGDALHGDIGVAWHTDIMIILCQAYVNAGQDHEAMDVAYEAKRLAREIDLRGVPPQQLDSARSLIARAEALVNTVQGILLEDQAVEHGQDSAPDQPPTLSSLTLHEAEHGVDDDAPTSESGSVHVSEFKDESDSGNDDEGVVAIPPQIPADLEGSECRVPDDEQPHSTPALQRDPILRRQDL